jgi:membrane protein DedA with SNARE-associated domain
VVVIACLHLQGHRLRCGYSRDEGNRGDGSRLTGAALGTADGIARCGMMPAGVPLASVLTFVEQQSQWALLLLFVLLTLESFGLPVPGETALIACSVLASQGSLSIVWVIVVGVLAAIIGDNLGYWAAREGGRPLLERYSLTRRYAERYLPRGERFFAKHGGKAVFFGRFVAILRVTAAWIAGISHMHWWRFFFWNAAGGIVWATSIALISYYLGDAAASALSRYGLYAAGGAILLSGIGFLIVRRLEKRVLEEK